jgi:enoyl-CoA hydratase/carnithine racemase
VRELAELLLSKPQAVVTAGKKFFYRQIEMDMEPAYRLASQVITDNMLGPDALEGVSAFAEKRKPQWPRSLSDSAPTNSQCKTGASRIPEGDN